MKCIFPDESLSLEHTDGIEANRGSTLNKKPQAGRHMLAPSSWV